MGAGQAENYLGDDMEFYRIIIKEKKDKFGKLFEILQGLGKFAISKTEIVCKTDIPLEDVEMSIKGILSNTDIVEVTKIKNIDQEIESLQVVDWVKREQFVDRSRVVDEEIKDRVTMMNEVLDEALKIYKKGGEKPKWKRTKERIQR